LKQYFSSPEAKKRLEVLFKGDNEAAEAQKKSFVLKLEEEQASFDIDAEKADLKAFSADSDVRLQAAALLEVAEREIDKKNAAQEKREENLKTIAEIKKKKICPLDTLYNVVSRRLQSKDLKPEQRKNLEKWKALAYEAYQHQKGIYDETDKGRLETRLQNYRDFLIQTEFGNNLKKQFSALIKRDLCAVEHLESRAFGLQKIEKIPEKKVPCLKNTRGLLAKTLKAYRANLKKQNFTEDELKQTLKKVLDQLKSQKLITTTQFDRANSEFVLGVVPEPPILPESLSPVSAK
jgi:hypothetical protein